MANSTTFERIQAPAAPDAPEPHTAGPYVRHGVMVRDTIETTGGMFCIRPGKPIVNHAGRTVMETGECIAYAYRRADADLMAAAPAMLAALRAILPYAESRLEDMEAEKDEAPDHIWQVIEGDKHLAKAREAFATAQAAIAAAEGRA